MKSEQSRLGKYVGQFLSDSTIHGVKYIGRRDRHISERVLWFFAVLACLGFSFYLVAEQYKKYFENPVIISFQPKQTSVGQIPFPAITICNINILKRSWMIETLKRLKDAFNTTNGNFSSGSLISATVLSEHLSHYCLAASSFRRVLDEPLSDLYGTEDFVSQIHDALLYLKANSSLYGIPEEIDETKYPGLSEIISFFKHQAMHSCDDMILKCLWARETVPCNVFRKVNTQHGSCCVFNMMPRFILRKLNKSDPRVANEMKHLDKHAVSSWEKYDEDDLILSTKEAVTVNHPKHQRTGGKPYGLSILVNPELETYGTCNSNDGYGFKVVAHSPISFPNIADYGVAVPMNNEVFINVRPELTTASQNDLGGVDVNKRGCYFPSDPQSNLYRKGILWRLETFHYFKACMPALTISTHNVDKKV